MSLFSTSYVAKTNIEDLIDIEELTQLFSNFYAATKFPVGMLDLQGNIIIEIGWQNMCTKFHRKHPEMLDNCRISNEPFQGSINQKNYHIQKCKNDLVDIVIPIKLEGSHLANLFFGQFYWEGEKPSEEIIRKTAQKYNFDAQDYLEAFRKVPAYNRDEVEKVVNFYQSLVTMITKMVSANLQLRQSEALQQILLDATDDTIALIEPSGTILKINTCGAKRFKQNIEDLIGKNAYDLLPPELKKLRKKNIDKVFKTGKANIFQDSRSNRLFENRVFPIFNEKKKVSHAGIFAIDITRRRQMENQLVESESRFRSFFEQGLIGMAITSPDKRWIQVNDSIFDMLGYTQKELFSKTWADISHPDDLEKEVALFNNLIHQQIGQYTMEKRFIKNDGNIIYTNLWMNSVVIDKKVDHIFALIDDITASKLAEEKLQNALNFNKSVVQDSPVGKAAYDATGQCIMVNKKAAEYVGTSTGQLLKQNYRKLESWQKSGLAEAADRVLEHGGSDKMEIHVKSSFGKEVWLECHFRRFYQNNEPHLLFIYNDVSENRYYQDELKENQQRFQLATEGANAGIWDWKLGTNEVFYSKIWKHHVGYEDHELKSEFATWEKLLHPDDSERMHHAVENYLKNPRGRFIEEFRMRHKNGSYRWIRNEASCLKDEDGNTTRMFGVHTDITETKEAGEALKESEERHRLIFESVNDAIFICNKAGNIIEVNTAATRIYGYSREEFLNLDPRKLLHEDWQHEIEAFFKTTSAGENYSGENVEYTKSGKIIYTQVYGTPLEFKGEKQIMAVVRNITSLKKAQDDLKHSKEQLQLITDLIPVLVSYITPDHRYEFVNKGYENWFGIKAEDVVGRHASEVVGKEAYDAVKEELDRVFQGETVEYERMMAYKSGGNKYTQTTFLPHKKDGRVEGAIVCVNDVTPLKEKENELRKLLDEVERSNKELEQFAYVASHDLQEPLRMVSSFLQLLERKYNEKLDDNGKEFIRYAVDGASRMKTLINDLLKYSRVGTRGKPFTTTSMNEVINQVLTNLSDTIKESGATFVLGKLPEIDADESQMVQLFQNLVSNAIKFRGDKSPQISITAKENKKQVTFTVSDNGIGIEPKFHERIFVIFQRLHTSDKYPGTGIGLAVCKKIVDRHHGTISLKSAIGNGTSFKIIIPKHLQTRTSNNEGQY